MWGQPAYPLSLVLTRIVRLIQSDCVGHITGLTGLCCLREMQEGVAGGGGGGGGGEGVVYLTSSGRLTEIGLQLGKACYPCSR